MIPETQEVRYAYALTIQTPSGQSITIPMAFLTRAQIADFLQSDFNRLAQAAGVKGARIELQHAETADYVAVLEEVAACLRRAGLQAA